MADSSSRKKDYSSQVRKKLASSSRTGQACDRCKVRRCNALLLLSTLCWTAISYTSIQLMIRSNGVTELRKSISACLISLLRLSVIPFGNGAPTIFGCPPHSALSQQRMSWCCKSDRRYCHVCRPIAFRALRGCA
jgi:hypothetical protein